MKLNLPKNSTFWAAVILAAVGVLAYVVRQFVAINYLATAGFLLIVVAFVLLCLGLTIKGL
jgi:hypothetical protein